MSLTTLFTTILAAAQPVAAKAPAVATYQCYFATYSGFTYGSYGDAPIAKLAILPGNRFTYGGSGGRYTVAGNGAIVFTGLKASYYEGAKLVRDGAHTAIQLSFGRYGVQNCVTK